MCPFLKIPKKSLHPIVHVFVKCIFFFFLKKNMLDLKTLCFSRLKMSVLVSKYLNRNTDKTATKTLYKPGFSNYIKHPHSFVYYTH